MTAWTDVLDTRRVADETVRRANHDANQGSPDAQMYALLAIAAEIRALADMLNYLQGDLA